MHAVAVGSAARSVEARIGDRLCETGLPVASAGPGRWTLAGARGGRPPVTVALDGGWIVVERALPGCRLVRVGHLHRGERHLLGARPGHASGARPVLPARAIGVRVRAERPLPFRDRGDEAAWQRWLEAAVADVAVEPGRTAQDAERDGDGGDVAEKPDLPTLCERAGWPATRRGDSGDFVIALPARGGAVCHAVASARGAGVGFAIPLETSADGDASPLCRAAVALALLRTAGSVRLVWATASHAGGRIAATLGVDLAAPLGAELVGDALSALAVAHRHAAAEIGALATEPSLARAYLTSQGVR